MLLPDTLKAVLSRYPGIRFALLFGSHAEDRAHAMSDVDVGVMFEDEPDMLELGELNGRLEAAVGARVDTVVLNRLYATHPRLAFNIVVSHRPLVMNEEEAYREFKYRTYMHYFDIEPTLKMLDDAFRKRWKSGTCPTP